MKMLKAKKHLWQNFLKNTSILNKIVGESTLSDTPVVEIGPGPGDLTWVILDKNPLSLSLIEIDNDMIPLLQKRFAWKNIQIYHQDILTTDMREEKIHTWKDYNTMSVHQNEPLNLSEYVVYGNIPYYITSPIIYHMLYEVTSLPTCMTITMQKEVADRILAHNEKHSVLSLTCHLMADIYRICDIHPNNFTPVPKVWSTCLKFNIKNDKNREWNKKLLQIIKTGFSQKRKKLLSNLIHNMHLSKEKIITAFEKSTIPPDTRAEDLTITQWKMLGDYLI